MGEVFPVELSLTWPWFPLGAGSPLPQFPHRVGTPCPLCQVVGSRTARPVLCAYSDSGDLLGASSFQVNAVASRLSLSSPCNHRAHVESMSIAISADQNSSSDLSCCFAVLSHPGPWVSTATPACSPLSASPLHSLTVATTWTCSHCTGMSPALSTLVPAPVLANLMFRSVPHGTPLSRPPPGPA